MTSFISDIAFSDSVKDFQQKEGSRAMYQRMADTRDWKTNISSHLIGFIAERDSFYIATTNADGQPYMQHRGGKPGFLKVLDERTLGFADFSGNNQYISAGNLQDNNKVCIFLMDYPSRMRIKIWGEARIIDKTDNLIKELEDFDYHGQIERGMIINVKAWDANCPQHITPRYTVEELEPHIGALKDRINELEVKLESCKPVI